MPVGTNYEADYVIVGAGSAGCVLAERLSASGAEVVLLEAGGKDTNPFIHVPAGVLKLVTHPVVNWNYYTEPDEKTGGRALHCPRGKVLGGSSSINGMLFIRGHAADYDNWAQMGARGWSYEDVLPHFKSIERYGPGDPGERGKSGPIQVEDYRTVLPLTDRFVEAAQQAGHPFARDLSARPPAEGVGYSQMSRNGRFRASTARTFLRRARGRANLRIETGAYATGLLFDGKRCTGKRISGISKIFEDLCINENLCKVYVIPVVILPTEPAKERDKKKIPCGFERLTFADFAKVLEDGSQPFGSPRHKHIRGLSEILGCGSSRKSHSMASRALTLSFCKLHPPT